MTRVLVIGSGGAGKSTVASTLAERTGLPLFHLDALYWKPGWAEPSREEWAQVVQGLVAGEQWIMDGNYGGTLEQRLSACDTVIFLDLPRVLCLWRVFRRWRRYRGRARPEMTPGCPERITREFLLWIWRYPSERRPGVLKRLSALGPHQHAIILRSSAEVQQFLASIPALRA